MQLFNYFLFISFINLYNSFNLINQKYYNNFLKGNYKNKINMGCDYYIDKDLLIYDYNNVAFSYINLDRQKGYYWFVSILDEDEEGYEEEYIKYKENKLEPYMKPLIIYSNNTFVKVSFEDKYKKIIECELNIYKKTWDDVDKIIKVENRYER